MGREPAPPRAHRRGGARRRDRRPRRPDYLPFIRRAHAAFGDALGLRADRPEAPSTTAIADASSALAFAIAEYGRLLTGELDRTDPDRVATFRRAMTPLDEHRATAFGPRSRPTDEPVVEPEPEVDIDEPMGAAGA
ncbi:MAG: hypothetical protein H6719_12360 [Sandaracinaceae bacterium]|nr:hypothetical protein [Sandaracinaceae bacterium]